MSQSKSVNVQNNKKQLYLNLGLLALDTNNDASGIFVHLG